MDRHDAERVSSERLEQATWLLRRSFRLVIGVTPEDRISWFGEMKIWNTPKMDRHDEESIV